MTKNKILSVAHTQKKNIGFFMNDGNEQKFPDITDR